jgi:hypothetical protein
MMPKSRFKTTSNVSKCATFGATSEIFCVMSGSRGHKHCKRHRCVGGVMAAIEMEQQPFQDAAT